MLKSKLSQIISNTKIFNTKNLCILLIIILVLPIMAYSTIRFGLSKDNISYPNKDHSHFRIKYIYQGQEEDFGSPRYQTDYAKDVCGGTLTTSPLHFHDNKTDYQHTHWTRMTGGQFFKFYGLNMIGGLDSHMGFKLDELPKITLVPIHSVSLPKPRSIDKLWVYSGVEVDGKWSVKNRTIDEFVNQDMETFFGVESQVRKDEEKYGAKKSFLNNLNGLVSNNIQLQAHDGEEHKTLDEATKHAMETKERELTSERNNQPISQVVSTNSSNINSISSQNILPKLDNKTEPKPETSLEELKSINNFLGDVVIFVQQSEPTNEQIKTRFQSMIKLEKSVCGG